MAMKQYLYLCLVIFLNLTACSKVKDNPSPLVNSTPTISSIPTINNLSGQFDSAMVWPLCGRISENPPSGWDVSQGCPSGETR